MAHTVADSTTTSEVQPFARGRRSSRRTSGGSSDSSQRMQSKQVGSVWAVKFDGSPKWAIVAHPLWDQTNPSGVLLEAVNSLGGDPFVIVDSFNLARRPVTIRRAILEGA